MTPEAIRDLAARREEAHSAVRRLDAEWTRRVAFRARDIAYVVEPKKAHAGLDHVELDGEDIVVTWDGGWMTRIPFAWLTMQAGEWHPLALGERYRLEDAASAADWRSQPKEGA